MLFNSFQFAAFFVIVYGLYLCLDHKKQNGMLLAASYLFYGVWDWRFLFLILASTVLDYYCGIAIHQSRGIRERKRYLFLSILGNLSLLGFFKYCNFFIDNLQALLSHLGITFHTGTLNIILPVGISFYTFQTMSYTIDVYKKELEPTKEFLDFALFVAFFPQLVAGPIERAKHLLPQVLNPRTLSLNGFYEGCYLIFWGLFQKIFIADNLAKVVDPIFTGAAPYNGSVVLTGVYAFAIQIFCDFAGYSDIARGLGKCLGFDIMVNFNLPYFAANPREFWKRWHISLSSWLRDYLYIPLGGNRRGAWRTYRNLTLTMLLGGLWHGAAWTFVLWGAYHGLLLSVHRRMEPLFNKIPVSKNAVVRNVRFAVKTIFFFHLVCLGWLIFRANSLEQTGQMLWAILLHFQMSGSQLKHTVFDVIFFSFPLFAVQLVQFLKNDLMAIYRSPVPIRTLFYYAVMLLTIIYGVIQGDEFIYFQF